MKAKKIKGQHCEFCGSKNVPLVKTPCCGHWICCDTKFISINGGGFCQEQHERFSLCYSHYTCSDHQGAWQDCERCKLFWTPEEYNEYTGAINVPQYPSKA